MSLYTRAAAVQAATEGPILAVLATSAKQADGLALNCRGVRLQRFEANPVLMTVHDHRRLPVGNVLDINVEATRITGRLVFGSDSEAQLLEQRVREGVIRAVSIGFSVDPGSVDREGNVPSWELTETSLVGVPMDAEALVYARSLERAGVVDSAAAERLLGAFRLPAVAPGAALDRRVRRIVAEVLRGMAR